MVAWLGSLKNKNRLLLSQPVFCWMDWVSGCIHHPRSLKQNMAYRRHTHSLPLLGGKRFQATFGHGKSSLKMQNRLVFCQTVFCWMDFQAAFGMRNTIRQPENNLP